MPENEKPPAMRVDSYFVGGKEWGCDALMLWCCDGIKAKAEGMGISAPPWLRLPEAAG